MKAQTRRSHIPIAPSSLTKFWNDVEGLTQQIHQRAYQLFEERGKIDGHDLEDWFKAESELLRPISFKISEKENVVHLRADVPGLKEEELEINLEPRAITIKGERREDTNKMGEITSDRRGHLERIYCRLPLPANVVVHEATATLEHGVLEIWAPKAEQERELKAA
jgi:HSP20 family protein